MTYNVFSGTLNPTQSVNQSNQEIGIGNVSEVTYFVLSGM